MSTTLLQLEQLLSEAIGDWREFDTSTLVTTGSTAKVLATTLANYDEGRNDYFNNWWLYFTEGNNSGKLRKVSDYATTSNTLKLRGTALSAESSAVTCRLHRFWRTNKVKALNRAMEQLYPLLHLPVNEMSLITGNSIPDGSFEWWTSATALKLFTASNCTLARTSTAGLIRGQRGSYSCKITNTVANGYVYISSDSYPPLLDLMDTTVSFYCWVYPENADDAWIQIYTLQADGTAQTLTSTTTCPAGKWTRLQLETQTLNADLVKLDVRFGVTTNLKYAYFDDAVLCGKQLPEYMLPWQFQTGHLAQVWLQSEAYSDEVYAYDFLPREWDRLDFDITNDGTYKYLQLHGLEENFHRLRLVGYKELGTLSADTDTIYLDGNKLNLIIAQAAFNLYQMERGNIASEDRDRFDEEMAYWGAKAREYRSSMIMSLPSDSIKGR